MTGAPKRAEAWTGERVEAALREAFRTVRLLPDPTVRALRGHGAAWPEVIREFADFVEARKVTTVRPPLPDMERITGADRALGWLWWLGGRERGIVIARCSGARWSRIMKHHGLGRTQCWRLYRDALWLIADALNGGRK